MKPIIQILFFSVLLLLATIDKLFGQSQNCLISHSDFTGLEWDEAERAQIAAEACKLQTLLAEAGVQGFKVHTFGFYGYNENMQGGTDAIWSSFLDNYVDTSTPHLAIGREFNQDGSFKKFWVSFEVPNSGFLVCLSPSDKNAIKNQLTSLVSIDSQNPSVLSTVKWLYSKINKTKNCCEIATGNLTCSDCQYSLAEAEAKLVEKGFYKIEAQNIGTEPFTYTTFQSNVRITYQANGNSINLTDELQTFLSAINGTAKVTSFTNTNCQGLSSFTTLDLQNFDYAEDIILLDFNGSKALYTNYSANCTANKGQRAFPIVIWLLRKAGEISAAAIFDLGVEVAIEKWVNGHDTWQAAFNATDLGCSDFGMAFIDNIKKSKAAGFLWDVSQPAIKWAIDTPSDQWTWEGFGAQLDAGLSLAAYQLVFDYVTKFVKSIKKHPAIGNNDVNANKIVNDVKEVIKENPKFLKDLYNSIYKWSMLNARLPNDPNVRKIMQKSNVYDYLDKVKKPTLGTATTNNWGDTFKKYNFPDLSPYIQAVHHAFPRQLLKDYPTLFTEKAIHSIENLRGIPKSDNFHQEITNQWTTFLKQNRSLKEIEDFALDIDNTFGHRYLPPIR